VKQPPGSPPAFKARYVARGFSQRQGRDYELHSLDFSAAFLQGSLHEEIWLRRPPSFTGSFPARTQWSLRQPIYGLRQAPREWHNTLRTTLAALGFTPSTTDSSPFLRTDTSLPPFYVLVYVLQRFGFQFSSPQPTPLSTSHSLSAPPLDESVEPSGPYPELVGCLITSGMGLVLGGRGPVVLTGHADASWVDDSATQRSSQGYTFSLGSGSVSWRSTRSSLVLSSSCEAEIYARAMAAQELRWLTYRLTDLGEQPCLPPQRGQLRLAYVASRANTADIFTKALPPGDHQHFSTVLGLLVLLFLTGLVTTCSPPLCLRGSTIFQFSSDPTPVMNPSSSHLLIPAAGRPNTKPYIVHLSSVPSVLSYRGGVNGLRATATVDDEEDEYEDEEDVDDVDNDEDYGDHGEDGDAGGDGNGGIGGGSGNGTAPGSAAGSAEGSAPAAPESIPDANGGDGNGSTGGTSGNGTAPGSAAGPVEGSAPEAAGAAAVVAAKTAAAESEEKMTGSESGEDGFDADVQFAAAATAEAALEIAGAAAGGAGRGLGGEGSGGRGGGGAVRVTALPFARTGLDALLERVDQRLRKMKSRSVGRRLLARVAAAAVAAAAEEAAEEAAGAAGGGGAAAAAAVTQPFQNASFYAYTVSATVSSVPITPSSASSSAAPGNGGAISASASSSAEAAPAGEKAPMASGATSTVLTVQQLSARAARIMRSTPWGRLTRPDVRLPHVQAFTRFLEASHLSLLQSLGIPSSAIFHSYTYLMNSFAAQLTTAEARRLKLHPAVADVERDRTVRVTSVHSPEFLKLDSSLWPANGGQSNAGEGVIIGVIDTGIWPEHPSFSNPVSPNIPPSPTLTQVQLITLLPLRAGEALPYSAAPVRWRGVCSKTDDFTACNGKVVGARFFLKGLEQVDGKLDTEYDYRSPRDITQHGTWCAGAAAGNTGVEVTVGGRTYGTASGMAPRARLAVYKALWTTVMDGGIGAFSDLVAAAENAVADGVDIISCSWGVLPPMYFQDLPFLRGLKVGIKGYIVDLAAFSACLQWLKVGNPGLHSSHRMLFSRQRGKGQEMQAFWEQGTARVGVGVGGR
ncbi:unnamed protein product, partial [Closterium sp. NIES-53]